MTPAADDSDGGDADDYGTGAAASDGRGVDHPRTPAPAAANNAQSGSSDEGTARDDGVS